MHGGSQARGLWSMKEAQRREARRADIRLQGGLQRLDEARTYHINTLTREQRKLQKDLLTMTTGNPWRRNMKPLWSQPFDPDSTLAVPYRTTLPKIPRAKKEQERHRSWKPQGCDGVSRPIGSGLYARIQDFLYSPTNGQNPRSATPPLNLPDVKPPSGRGPHTTGPGDRREVTETGGGEGPERKKRTVRKREREINRQRYVLPPSPPFPPPPPPSPSLTAFLAPDGRPRTIHILPDFNQSLGEARKARYIRHRGQPSCEKELSITEIFACSEADSAYRYG